MKIYVASSWRNEYQPGVVRLLVSFGYAVYDFRHPTPDNDGFSWAEIDENWQAWSPNQYIAALEHPRAVEGFNLDFDAMKWADICVLVLPCGRSAHLEAGWFVGAGKPLVIYIPFMSEADLMYKMTPHIATSTSDLINCVAEIQDTLRKAGS